MSATAQQAAFATGVLPDLYAFHRYTRNSACLYSAPAAAVRTADAGLSPALSPHDLTGPPTRPLRPMIPDNARTLRITAAAGTELAGASSPGTVRPLERGCSSRATVVYTPKGVLPHAASLRQSFDHCARFPTAASRRSLGRLSVPMWLAILSDQLPVVALVGHYPAN